MIFAASLFPLWKSPKQATPNVVFCFHELILDFYLVILIVPNVIIALQMLKVFPDQVLVGFTVNIFQRYLKRA